MIIKKISSEKMSFIHRIHSMRELVTIHAIGNRICNFYVLICVSGNGLGHTKELFYGPSPSTCNGICLHNHIYGLAAGLVG